MGSSDWGRSIWVRGARRRAGGADSGTAHGGGGVAAREHVGDVCERGRVPRGGPGGAGGFSRVHLATGARWTKSTGGVRRAARNRAPERREMEVRAFL